jgi:K+-sensing histidine kinase KdpD
MKLVTSLSRLRRQRPWLAFAISFAIFLFALLVRFVLGDTLQDVPFITLFPAILIAALVGGLQAGIVTILSGVAAWYWLMPPEDSFALHWSCGVITMVFFIITSAIELYVIRTFELGGGSALFRARSERGLISGAAAASSSA